VERGSRGFGLSLIYRGLDKYEEKDTGIFVARVVPGGQAARYGVRENDKILTINQKTPRNVDDAVGVIKQAGNQIKLVVLREEDVPAGQPDISIDPADDASLQSGEIDSKWMRDSLGPQAISRSGSARSFNTSFGRPPASPSPRPPRAQFGQPGRPRSPGVSSSLPGHPQGGHGQSYQQQLQQQQLLEQQQQEFRRQQDIQRQQELQRQAQAQAQAEAQARRQQELAHQDQQRRLAEEAQKKRMQPSTPSVQDTVRDILSNSIGLGPMDETRPKSSGALYPPNSTITEIRRSREDITRIVETVASGQQGNKYKSTQSLHDLGLDNYPNPEMPESSRLTRREEKQSLQNLNNRLAGYIDKVRSLQQENNRLTRVVEKYELTKSSEVTHIKEMYDKQVEDLKAALDNMNKQYNQLKVGAEGLLQENTDIKNNLQKKDADVAKANDRTRNLEDEMRNMANQLSLLDAEKCKLAHQLQDTLPDIVNLKEKLQEAKSALDQEQLKSADLDSKCDRLKSDLEFEKELLKKELEEVKHRMEIEVTQVDCKVREEYDEKLQDALNQLREMYDGKMRENREDLEKLYEERVKDLQSQLSNARGNNASTLQELKESKSRIASLMSKVSDLEGANLALNQKIADLAQEMEDLKGIHRAQIAAKDDEIQRLLDELANQLKEYQDLQDIKIALDMEIAVFRRLIETEEDRLGLGDKSMDMSDSSTSASSRTPPARVSVERTTESSYQRKITVNQTQL